MGGHLRGIGIGSAQASWRVRPCPTPPNLQPGQKAKKNKGVTMHVSQLGGEAPTLADAKRRQARAQAAAADNQEEAEERVPLDQVRCTFACFATERCHALPRSEPT